MYVNRVCAGTFANVTGSISCSPCSPGLSSVLCPVVLFCLFVLTTHSHSRIRFRVLRFVCCVSCVFVFVQALTSISPKPASVSTVSQAVTHLHSTPRSVWSVTLAITHSLLDKACASPAREGARVCVRVCLCCVLCCVCCLCFEVVLNV